MKAFEKRTLYQAVLPVFMSLTVVLCGAFSHNAYATTAARIGADAKSKLNRSYNKTAAQIKTDTITTLNRFYREVEGARELTSSAKALLVMSGITKAGFFVGGEYGQGELQVGGETDGYYNLIAGSYGFTFGAQKMDLIIAFMTEEALNQFKKIQGWEAGVDGNVALIDIGGGKRIDTTSLKDPVVAFVFSPQGIMFDISLKGAKFTKIKK
jgi:lipid-binding SYLF domain-containing protein